MINERHVTRAAIFVLALGFVGLGYRQTRARADGIPGMQPLTYAGQLEEAGLPVNGTRNLRLTVWDDATSTESSRTRCITTASGAMVTSGRFQVVLDNACTAVVRSTPDLWLEIEVNGSSLGRTKLSAVPFAIEAGRASGLTAAAANALVPTGTIVAFGGSLDRVPAGWVPCDGRSLTRAMQPALFDALGTAHGGDGTNFNVPDYRGRFLRGVDGMAGRDPDSASRSAANMGGNSGNAIGSVQADAFRRHSHGFDVRANTGNTVADLPARGNSLGGTVSTLEAGGAETRPLNASVNFIIKL